MHLSVDADRTASRQRDNTCGTVALAHRTRVHRRMQADVSGGRGATEVAATLRPLAAASSSS
eukprot:361497-Chlamydomonas_euryale.AAC.3